MPRSVSGTATTIASRQLITHATGAIGQLFAEIRAKFALVPNLFRVLANAPAALEGLTGLSAALACGALDDKTREQLALAIAESNFALTA